MRFPLPFILGEALLIVTGKFSAFFKTRALISGMLFLRGSQGALTRISFLACGSQAPSIIL